MKSPIKLKVLLVGSGLAIIGYFFLGRCSGESEGRNHEKMSSRKCRDENFRVKTLPQSRREIIADSMVRIPPEVQAVWDKWKEKEQWVDRMSGGRPEAFQKSLEESPPPDLKFGGPVLLKSVDAEEGAKFTYVDDRTPLRLKIDGRWSDWEGYAYGRRGDLAIMSLPGRSEASRLVRISGDVEGETVAVLPRLNYHENRRWLIDGWAFLSDGDLLGLSHEEDGKSEQVVKSHFYSYGIQTKTLRTLVLPESVDSYQALTFHGVDIGTGTIKITDEKENVYFVRYVREEVSGK